MIPELRARFNRQWKPEQYSHFLAAVNARAGTDVGFRLLETPVFIPAPLLKKMCRYGLELYEQLAADPAYRIASDAAIPPQFQVQNEDEHPLFIQADFGLVRESDGTLEPKLVEIQGFPSLYAFQSELAEGYQDSFRLNEILGCQVDYMLEDLTPPLYQQLMLRAILNGHSPEHVVLLEIDPFSQKTLADFLATQRLVGLRIASLTDVEKRGRKLFLDGIEIRRIYNRVIVDELLKKNLKPSFKFTDDLDVEWAGHPNWFFRLSKFSLPWLKHVCVPETRFLNDVRILPEDLCNYVLKPLYSFAGTGVVIGPKREEIEAIPTADRSLYILQKKMAFVPVVETPDGSNKVEVRIMYVRDQGEYKAVTTIIRTGRGKMMGVDFNKSLDWVGASAGFFPIAS